MRKKLFLSTLALILLTLISSMISVNWVFQRQFSNYLMHSTETSIDQLPNQLSDLYKNKSGWDQQALKDLSHNLPLGTEVTLISPTGQTLATLTNPMESMMQNSMGNMMMGMNYSFQEWQTKTLTVKTPEATLATAQVRYPGSAQIISPQDVSFISAIFRSLLLAGGLALIIGTLLSYWTSRRLVSPLQQLIQAVYRVGEGNLDERVPATAQDEVGQLALAFNAMADNLKKQEHMRKQFTADIAHELRTPLTSIRSYIEAFQDGILPANTENLTIINEEIERLVSLSSDLKDLNVAEIGMLKPNIYPLNLGELLDKVVSKLLSLIQKKNIQLGWRKPNENITIQGDERLLTRLFYNLIHNAYKYTEDGGQIRIGIEPTEEVVLIRIKDTGVGISEDDLPYIFERFYRAEKSRARETGGTGIGLALVQQIAQLHHGIIEVESTSGQGSQFTVILPIQQFDPTNPTLNKSKAIESLSNTVTLK